MTVEAIFYLWKAFNNLKGLTDKLGSKKHEDLRYDSKYNSSEKLYLYFTKYLFK
jgi:hypothetical protein